MILFLCGIIKNDKNELVYPTEIDPQTQTPNLWLPKGKEMGKNKLGVWG